LKALNSSRFHFPASLFPAARPPRFLTRFEMRDMIGYVLGALPKSSKINSLASFLQTTNQGINQPTQLILFL
jgi:hypothetical protein